MPRPPLDRSRPSRPRLLILLVLATLWGGCVSDPRWRQTESGRFQAETRGWTLVVDPERARLTELHPPGGAQNLLAAGGHIVWLGPQAEWPREWPPLHDWHAAAAERVERRDGGRTLRVVGAHSDDRYPRIVRDYVLHREGVELIVRWAGDGEPRQAVQIVQIHPEARVHVVPQPTPDLPHGIGHLPLVPARDRLRVEAAPEPRFASPGPVPGQLVLHRGDGDAKFGLPPQTLWADLPGGARLGLAPGPIVGRVVDTPDAGLTTQVYLGREELAFVEIEQLSPRLAAANPGGEVSHTASLILLPSATAEARAPAADQRALRGARRAALPIKRSASE